MSNKLENLVTEATLVYVRKKIFSQRPLDVCWNITTRYQAPNMALLERGFVFYNQQDVLFRNSSVN